MTEIACLGRDRVAFFGHEQLHQLIRLLTDVEIAEHLEYYDGQHDDYKH